MQSLFHLYFENRKKFRIGPNVGHSQGKDSNVAHG